MTKKEKLYFFFKNFVLTLKYVKQFFRKKQYQESLIYILHNMYVNRECTF